jgi:hypothetical protein
MNVTPPNNPCGNGWAGVAIPLVAAANTVTFTDIGGGQRRAYITMPGTGTLTVPTNWTTTNTIEVIGGGAGGGGLTEAGGGGGYSKRTNGHLEISLLCKFPLGKAESDQRPG